MKMCSRFLVFDFLHALAANIHVALSQVACTFYHQFNISASFKNLDHLPDMPAINANPITTVIVVITCSGGLYITGLSC